MAKERKYNPAIEPNVNPMASEDLMAPEVWKHTKNLVNETFKWISLYAEDGNLQDKIFKGPYHFYISLEVDNGLYVFFGLRKSVEPQRVYAEDIRGHSMLDYYINNLSKEYNIDDPEYIQFWPWEFEDKGKIAGYSNRKASEFISKSISKSGKAELSKPLKFSSIEAEIDEKLVFVLMPFSEDWSNRIWLKYLKPIIENSGYQATRADDLFGKEVVEDIWESIKKAKIIVADVTNPNPNVFYELGIAHALEKPTIILTQSSRDVPIDIITLRHIEYSDNADGYEKIELRLPEVLDQISRNL